MPAKKYFEGMMLGKDKNICFIKDLGYVNGRKKGIFECPVCHRKDWETGLADIISGKSIQCKNCASKKHRDRLIEWNKKQIIDLTGQTFGKLTVLQHLDKKDNSGHYLNKCQCSCINKTIIFVNSSDLKSGKVYNCGCEKIYSKGETKIAELLNKMNIMYSREYKFIDCINPKTNSNLRYDFYLPDYNICIEYDGRQHFENHSLEFFTKKETIQDRQYRDKIKDNYCKKNNIGLIRIPYYNYNKITEEYLLNLINIAI